MINESNREYAKKVYMKIAERKDNSNDFKIDEETKHRWSLTGIRHIIRINERMGSPMSDKEWADMSIR